MGFLKQEKVGSLIFAAGRGSRMKEFDGNKTLLPLIPHISPFKGDRPILLNIIANLPDGPKAVVINYRSEEVVKVTHGIPLQYILQPELNGTGGALLAARAFLERDDYEKLIITMGDVPLVSPSTYLKLSRALDLEDFVILAFSPSDKKQYGLLGIRGRYVERIVEHKYWSILSCEKQSELFLANAGIYAGRREIILGYLPAMESRPHVVLKNINGLEKEIREYFITDLVEIMRADGRSTGYIVAQDEQEVMGVDDLAALTRAQEIFSARLER
ncbi:MAG: MobA-like NTP transferase domain containing protein [Desulfobacteraceae bacterium]|jgi:bifunctional UDP-N-acetylglucosamine pyrophosphorylase/glucosamine-1-phosphate N-acetyltransferase|nr:MAG: MobA-like NTP transferase domain containing protein [Desulfobacteraceae bacterium]